MNGTEDRGTSSRESGQTSATRAEGSMSLRVVVKYALVQIPALVVLVLGLLWIEQWTDLPGWLFWSILLGWVAKDMILFPLTWRSYLPDHTAHPWVGMEGVVQERLAPRGFVRVRGELWQAEVPGDDPVVEPGEPVWILEVRGLQLVVTPENPGKHPHSRE